MEPFGIFSYLFSRAMPVTRRQLLLNVGHRVSNIQGTNTHISFEFKNTHHCLWRCPEGDVVTTIAGTFPPVHLMTPPLDMNTLLSPTSRDSLVRGTISCFHLSSFGELVELETRVSLCLLNLVLAAAYDGYSAMNAALLIDVATIDTYYDEEDVARATSIEALPSQPFDGKNSSKECTICLDEYSPAVTVTRLPCSHDFHRGCIVRWLNLNVNKSCPICRSPI